MVFEEFFNERVQLPIQLVICMQGCKVLTNDALKDELTDVRERLIIVILADGEVDVATGYKTVHHTNEHLDIFVNLFVHIILLQRLSLRRQALKLLHELYHEARGLFVDDEAINGPSIEFESICSVIDQLIE